MSYQLQKNASLVAVLLRVGFGGLMFFGHGYDKLQTLMSLEEGKEVPFIDPIGIGKVTSLVLVVFAEFLCSIFVMVGFRTRLASFFLIVTMLVAIFSVHWSDPFLQKELALLYLIGFSAIAFLGGQRYAITKG